METEQFFTEVGAFRLRNFMGFRTSGWVKVCPITLVFGGNSTGKSALIKGLRLLKQSLTDASSEEALLFYSKEGVDLGAFKTAVYQQNATLSIGFDFKVHLADKQFNIEGWSFDDYLILSYEFTYSEGRTFLSRFELYSDAENPDRSLIIQLTTDGYRWDRQSTFFKLDEGDHAPAWQQSRLHKRRSFLVDLGSEINPVEVSMRIVEDYDDSPEEPIGLDPAELTISIPLEQIIEYQPTDPRLDLVRTSEASTVAQVTIDPAPNFSKVASVVRDVQNLIENFIDSIVHVAPVRPVPQRYSIVRWPFIDSFIGKIILYKKDDAKYIERLNNWLSLRSGLGITIDVRLLGVSSDVPVYQLEVTEKDSDKHLPISLRDVGSGVSQLLPVLVEVASSNLNQLLIIEQPELHLHPKAQISLADLFVEAIKEGKKRFLIETHSEHLLLQFRYRIAESNLRMLEENRPADPSRDLTPEQLAIYFVDRKAGASNVEQINVNEFGDMEDQPDGFKEFFADDAIKVMEITNKALKAEMIKRRQK